MMKADKVVPNEVTYGTLLNRAKDFQQGLDVLEMMKADKVVPNEVTYGTLLNRAKDFQQGLDVLEMMKADKVVPDDVTYTTLLNRAKDFQQGLDVLEMMKADKVVPNEVTYGTVLNRAKDFQQGLDVLEMMKADKVVPDDVTWTTLITKAPSVSAGMEVIEQLVESNEPLKLYMMNAVFSRPLGEIAAEVILDWFLKLPHQPDRSMEALIGNYYNKERRTKDALRVALHYPYLSAAKKLMRDIPRLSNDYFIDAQQQKGLRADALYALAIQSLQQGSLDAASKYISEAIVHAKTDTKKERLREWKKDNIPSGK
ncbi:MAG: hypothetical protein IPN30_02280 [Flavobacteriales bacterium]|nr:hypothetical protein [Flavobacteriales bacterium]